jgi:hypothetical protein
MSKMESSKLNNEKQNETNEADCHMLALLLCGKFEHQTSNS